MTQNRETSRDALTTLLSSALTGEGNAAQTVIGHKPTKADVQQQSPLVAVMSAGSDRPRMTYQGGRLEAYFIIEVWVLASATGWTAAQAEDRLDLIEKDIASVIESNCSTSNWNFLGYDGRSEVMDIAYDGVPYIRERIPVVIKVHR